MMKTATVTWISYNNCGTFLQAYALQHIVEKLKCCNVILDDQSKLLVQYRPKRNLAGIAKAIKNKLQLFLMRDYLHRVNSSYSRFRELYLKLENPETIADDIDIYICGSDQIWNPSLRFNSYYYLDFTEKTKIAYAPSIGSDVVTEEWMANALPLIKRFAHLSVREEQGAAILSRLTGTEVPSVSDPTLLLPRADWEKLCADETCIKSKNYVFCYMLTPNKAYLNIVHDYCRAKGLDLVMMGIHLKYRKCAAEVLWGGPSEFLTAIRNATTVITDSFHATVFSIIFGKNFYTFQRFSENDKSSQNSRLLNLFQKLNIRGRFVKDNNWDVIEELDYPDIYERLDREKDFSINYLQTALTK